MKNTAVVTGGKPIAVLLQSMSSVSAINPLVAFYDIHREKREVLFFYFVLDTTRNYINNNIFKNFLTYYLKECIDGLTRKRVDNSMSAEGLNVQLRILENSFNSPTRLFNLRTKKHLWTSKTINSSKSRIYLETKIDLILMFTIFRFTLS
jgi:hypothetical protein